MQSRLSQTRIKVLMVCSLNDYSIVITLHQDFWDSNEVLSIPAEEPQNTGLFSTLGVSVLTNVVQSKGKELMSGGLDALEFLGKRTMDVLSEGDPALRKKREAITGKGSTLSQVRTWLELHRGCGNLQGFIVKSPDIWFKFKSAAKRAFN